MDPVYRESLVGDANQRAERANRTSEKSSKNEEERGREEGREREIDARKTEGE